VPSDHGAQCVGYCLQIPHVRTQPPLPVLTNIRRAISEGTTNTFPGPTMRARLTLLRAIMQRDRKEGKAEEVNTKVLESVQVLVLLNHCRVAGKARHDPH